MSEMSDHKFDVDFDDMEVDQKYKDEAMFSQSAQKEQDLESDIDMIEEEIKRKNERIIELELMLEEKEDWFNLKSHIELNHVHARHSELVTDDEAIDVTNNEKIRAKEEKTVLPSDQTGSSYDGEDCTDKVGYEKRVNTCFDIIFEKPKKHTSKPKLSSEKRKIVNLIPNVTDLNMIKSNENKDDVELEKNKYISFDIVFENPKKQMSTPKLSFEKRKPVNLIPNVIDQNIKSNENKKDVRYEEKKNISFDIGFDSPKKQRTKPKLTSGGGKAQFQWKHIDEKKDKSHDKEQKEDATTADSQIAVQNRDSAYKEEQVVKKNVSFDVFFESPKKLKPKPKLSFINRKQENKTKNNIDEKEIQEEQKHEKSHIELSQTTDANLSKRGKLRGVFENDVLIQRKYNNEIRFRFSFLHGTTTIPSRIPVMVRRLNGENASLKRLNNERPRINSARRIPVRVLSIIKTNKATIAGPLAVRSFPESKISVRRGTDIKINSTKNAKSSNGDDRRSPRKRERCTKLPRITRKSRIPVRIKGYVWNTYESEGKRKIDESRRLLAPLSRIPIPKDKMRRQPSDCIIPRLDPNEHLPQIFQSFSKREEHAKIPEVNRNLVSPNPMSISEKGERTCPGSLSELLQLPSITTQNAMVKTSHPASASGLTRLTQIKGRKESVDENNILSPSAIATLPPIVKRNDTYINRPLSASGYAKLPPINSTNKTMTMDRPMSARLSPLFTTFENTENRPLSACGSPKLPPIIDGNPLEMCRPTSSLSGFSLLPPIPSYKRGSVEDGKVPVEESNRSRGN
ncbi:unnamed protein product [Mytilus edulis]|uniref:Uncharacterized protein n=1 Tax=Mytilus edulis TaxID=6550 RepID=A0A8S3SQR2_MYTED|nr:unnamed protein product [Mytilus edulis]